RQAAETLWKTRPLDLSKRNGIFTKKLQWEDYEAILYGPFCSLNLQSVYFGRQELDLLVQSSKLSHLDLESNNLGPEEAKIIASANLPSLSSLNLNANRIGDEGAKRILSATFPSLTSLSL